MDVDQFNEAVAVAPTVVLFSATWCGPCKRLKPLFSELQKKMADSHPELQFLLLDVDQCPSLADKLKVGSIPDSRFYRNGVCIGQFTGADTEKFREGVEKLADSIPQY